MAMNRYGYLNYRNLEVGDQVSWEHPVTGKVYDFEVTELDLKDEYQPVELRLLDDVAYNDIVNVSEYAEFGHKGTRSWVYKSLEAHRDRYGYDADPNSITLDRLFYTSVYNEPKVDGRILADRESIEDFATAKGASGDGSSENSAQESLVPDLKIPYAARTIEAIRCADDARVCELQGGLQIPSAEEVNQYRYTGQADFQKIFVEQLAEAIKQDEDHIKLPPVLVEMYRVELINLGYRIDFDTVYFAKFD